MSPNFLLFSAVFVGLFFCASAVVIVRVQRCQHDWRSKLHESNTGDAETYLGQRHKHCVKCGARTQELTRNVFEFQRWCKEK